ncbi:MAG: signal peptidase II [Thermotaleaceae bacterium]
MSYLVIAAIIILDQVSKFLVINQFDLHQSIPVINNIFHITYVRNYGAAFGILKHQKLFFVIMTTIVVIGIIFYIRKQSFVHAMMKYSLSLIVGGAIGNLVDRLSYGYVIDFFDFRVWPVFNIADMAIVIGAIFLCYYLIFIEQTA